MSELNNGSDVEFLQSELDLAREDVRKLHSENDDLKANERKLRFQFEKLSKTPKRSEHSSPALATPQPPEQVRLLNDEVGKCKAQVEILKGLFEKQTIASNDVLEAYQQALVDFEAAQDDLQQAQKKIRKIGESRDNTLVDLRSRVMANKEAFDLAGVTEKDKQGPPSTQPTKQAGGQASNSGSASALALVGPRTEAGSPPQGFANFPGAPSPTFPDRGKTSQSSDPPSAKEAPKFEETADHSTPKPAATDAEQEGESQESHKAQKAARKKEKKARRLAEKAAPKKATESPIASISQIINHEKGVGDKSITGSGESSDAPGILENPFAPSTDPFAAPNPFATPNPFAPANPFAAYGSFGPPVHSSAMPVNSRPAGVEVEKPAATGSGASLRKVVVRFDTGLHF